MRTKLSIAVAGVILTTGLAACSGDIGGEGDSGGEDELTIGFVSTETGALAPFGEANAFVVDEMKKWFDENPLEVDGDEYDVKIVVKDARSDSTRAAEVTTELINDDGADVVITSGTPDIANPVSEQCEANSVPCITTVAPWQPYAIRSGDQPAHVG